MARPSRTPASTPELGEIGDAVSKDSPASRAERDVDKRPSAPPATGRRQDDADDPTSQSFGAVLNAHVAQQADRPAPSRHVIAPASFMIDCATERGRPLGRRHAGVVVNMDNERKRHE